ncbi:hypothetical protein [Burkholderia cenocepacia]|uniref:hypothetical protein n=1 Tax=Burkholderia cenocepacia TaxID=95486 RepID=UPI00123750AA|nr:hypothetical protein [Burkholderia cenocepacia]
MPSGSGPAAPELSKGRDGRYVQPVHRLAVPPAPYGSAAPELDALQLKLLALDYAKQQNSNVPHASSARATD